MHSTQGVSKKIFRCVFLQAPCVRKPDVISGLPLEPLGSNSSMIGVIMEVFFLEKNEVRQVIRRQRAALSAEQVSNASTAVLKKFVSLDVTRRAEHVAMYLSDENEIETGPMIEWLQFHNKAVYLPVVQGENLVFCSYESRYLVRNKFNILEPDPSRCPECDLSLLDIIIIPLVAFDNQLARIGRGAGYYDRALAGLQQLDKPPLLIGFAYHMQRIADCSPQHHDVKMDYIITP